MFTSGNNALTLGAHENAGLGGYAAINQRGNQVVSGVAINMLAAGLAVVLGNEWFREGGRTPSLPPEGRFLPLQIPWFNELADIPGFTVFSCSFRYRGTLKAIK